MFPRFFRATGCGQTGCGRPICPPKNLGNIFLRTPCHLLTYVDDNLVFTNCETMRQQFAAHCNKRVRFNDEGPVRWYLGTQYDSDPNTGSVSASQELYINKLLTLWHMLDCNPTKIPCSGKLDEILTSLQQVPATPNQALLKEYKELIGSLLFLQTGTIPEISWIVSFLARYMTKAGEPHMAAAKRVLRYLQSRKKISLKWFSVRYGKRPAWRYSRLRRRFLCRHPGHKPVLNRLRFPRQRQRHLLALY